MSDGRSDDDGTQPTVLETAALMLQSGALDKSVL